MARKREWRSGRRSVATRPVQMTRHLVVCEGTETEPRYFEGLKGALGPGSRRKISIMVRGSGKHTLGFARASGGSLPVCDGALRSCLARVR